MKTFSEILKPQENSVDGETNQAKLQFDFYILFLTCLGSAVSLLNLGVLLFLIAKNVQRSSSIILATSAAASIVHLACIICYTLERKYDVIPLYWLSTMAVSCSNWCLLPLLVSVVVEAYSSHLPARWLGPRKAIMYIIAILFVSCLLPFPGAFEIYYYSKGNCFDILPWAKSLCKFDFDTIILLQTKILPFFVYGLPFIASMVLVVAALYHYSAVNNVRSSTHHINPDPFGEERFQILLTATWFLVYYFPTGVLLLQLRAGDSYESQKEFTSAKGMIKFALIFRTLNTLANFFSNIIVSRQFRKQFCKILRCCCCRVQ